jgi:quinol-cytochrome oxidoreductase complex cytochrome b subunit
MQVLAVVATTLWFALNGLLWYSRPGEIVWFVGSVSLGIVYFSAFFWYVTRRR